jgi:glycerol-3-phosphate dehydrogenase
VKNTELYAALKNIIALILWYYEGQWAGVSSRGYYFSKLLWEMKWVISLLDGNSQIDFTDYALSWDLIATCFGGSRNRLLGNMLGHWKDITDALSELKAQNKIAEWYETLKWVYNITQGTAWFEEINNFGKKYINIIPLI